MCCTVIVGRGGQWGGGAVGSGRYTIWGRGRYTAPHLCHASEGDRSIRSGTRPIPKLPGSTPRPGGNTRPGMVQEFCFNRSTPESISNRGQMRGERDGEGRGERDGEGRGERDGEGRGERDGEGRGERDGEGRGERDGEGRGERDGEGRGERDGEGRGERDGEGRGERDGEGRGERDGEGRGEGWGG